MEEEAGKVIRVSATWATEWWTLWVALFSLVVSFGTLAVLGITAFYVNRQLRHALEERVVHMISTRWEEEDMEEARQAANSYKDGCELRDAINALEAKNSRHSYVLTRIPGFFEDLGLVCGKEENLTRLVKNLIGPSVKYYYKLYLPLIIQQQDDPTEGTYLFFKKLAERM